MAKFSKSESVTDWRLTDQGYVRKWKTSRWKYHFKTHSKPIVLQRYLCWILKIDGSNPVFQIRGMGQLKKKSAAETAGAGNYITVFAEANFKGSNERFEVWPFKCSIVVHRILAVFSYYSVLRCILSNWQWSTLTLLQLALSNVKSVFCIFG